MPANFCILAPLQDSHARELRAVIRDNRLWLTATLGDNGDRESGRDSLGAQALHVGF